LHHHGFENIQGKVEDDITAWIESDATNWIVGMTI
jgi:hypothetical protein